MNAFNRSYGIISDTIRNRHFKGSISITLHFCDSCGPKMHEAHKRLLSISEIKGIEKIIESLYEQ